MKLMELFLLLTNNDNLSWINIGWSTMKEKKMMKINLLIDEYEQQQQQQQFQMRITGRCVADDVNSYQSCISVCLCVCVCVCGNHSSY